MTPRTGVNRCTMLPVSHSHGRTLARALCTHGSGKHHLNTPESGAACLLGCLFANLPSYLSYRVAFAYVCAQSSTPAHELAIFMNTRGMRRRRDDAARYFSLLSADIFLGFPQPLPADTASAISTPDTPRQDAKYGARKRNVVRIGCMRMCVCVCSGKRYFHLDFYE